MTTEPPTGNPPSIQPPALPQPSGGPDDVFARIRTLGIVRPDEGRWAAGVAAALARRWGVDPILVRGGFVALSLFFGVGLFLYGVCWLLLPHPDGRIHAQEVLRGTVTAGFVGSVLAILAGTPFGGGWGDTGWSFGPGLLTLAVVGGVAWWLFHRRGRRSPSGAPSGASVTGPPGAETGWGAATTTAYEPPTASARAGTEAPGTETGRPPAAAVSPPAPPRAANAPWRPLTLVTLGLALLTGTLVYLLHDTWAVAGAAGLGVIGVGLVLSGLAGRRGGLLVPVAIVLALTSLGSTAGQHAGGAFGDQSWTPVNAAQARDGFSTGVGSTTVDLTSAALVAGATSSTPVTVAINQGVGELIVIVPSGVAVRVSASAGAGRIDDQVNDVQREGFGDQLVVDSGSGSPLLEVTAQLGLGEIVVRQVRPTPAVPAA